MQGKAFYQTLVGWMKLGYLKSVQSEPRPKILQTWPWWQNIYTYMYITIENNSNYHCRLEWHIPDKVTTGRWGLKFIFVIALVLKKMLYLSLNGKYKQTHKKLIDDFYDSSSESARPICYLLKQTPCFPGNKF